MQIYGKPLNNDRISPIIVNRKKVIPCSRTGIVETDDGIEYLPQLGNITAIQSIKM